MSDPAPSPQDYLDAADKALATWAPSDLHRLAADYIASPWFRAAVDSAFAAGVRAAKMRDRDLDFASTFHRLVRKGVIQFPESAAVPAHRNDRLACDCGHDFETDPTQFHLGHCAYRRSFEKPKKAEEGS